MTVTQDKDTKKTIITTDYKGSRWPQEVGQVVTVQLHGREYETEVISHTHGTGIITGGTIEYEVVEEDWKRVELDK
jgi:hypothetical protein